MKPDPGEKFRIHPAEKRRIRILSPGLELLPEYLLE